MNWKKIRKIIFIVLGILLFVVAAGIGYIYYQIEGKYDINEDKYTHYIGYLPNSTETPKFKRCNDAKTVGWFASAATYAPIFNGSKTNFKKYIKNNFLQVNSADNGFLNLRFIINCEGEVGNMEVNELDDDYQPTNLYPKLVEQLTILSSRKENWVVPIFDDEPIDSYMYLIYKIENGEIAEILP